MLEQALGSYLPEDSDVLDAGSADGPSASWIRVKPHSRVVSLDLHTEGLGSGGVCGSIMELPFGDGSFDAVCAFDVIEHCEPEARALAEVRRVLRPGGTFLMAVPAYQWAWTAHDVASGHYRRYTAKRARVALEQAGFGVDRVTYGFCSVFPLFALQRGASKVLNSKDDPTQVDELPKIPRAVHRVLMRLCRLDEALLGRRDLPFGSSVFVAAHRRA